MPVIIYNQESALQKDEQILNIKITELSQFKTSYKR